MWGVGILQQWKQGNTCLTILQKAANLIGGFLFSQNNLEEIINLFHSHFSWNTKELGGGSSFSDFKKTENYRNKDDKALDPLIWT